MKKIIATVLAMVMALALCSTAFAAADKFDVYSAKDIKDISSASPYNHMEDVEIKTVAAVKTASISDLEEVKGISHAKAEMLYNALRNGI